MTHSTGVFKSPQSPLPCMGNTLTKLFDILGFSTAKEQVQIIMIGLDAVGKTTLLYQMKLGESIATMPTIGFNVETVKYKNLSFTVWDIGGQSKIRALWGHYFEDASAIIYLLDSSDPHRLEEACLELEKIIESHPELPYLIFANKQDIANCLSVEEIKKHLNLYKISAKHIAVLPLVASTGEGLEVGFEWLSKAIDATRDSLSATAKS